MKRALFANSLYVAAVNVGFAILAFLFFIFPRFTDVGGILCLLILLFALADIVLVLRDLFRPGTRGRALVAVLLWLPVLFLFAMIMQWEGPLYVALGGKPPVFQLRGLAGVCGLELYGPEQENPEWLGDDVGLLWRIDNAVRFPFEASFKYGEVPPGFAQVAPAARPAPPLDPQIKYKVVVDRCMGGPQNFSLQGGVISEYKPSTDVCFGDWKIPERQQPALVRVDCNTRQPLPMSERAKRRLEQYRKNRIPFY